MKREPMPGERERELHAFRRGDRAADPHTPWRVANHAWSNGGVVRMSPERFAAERGRPGPSSRRRCGAPATGRRSSAATACAGSATLYRAAAADLAFARRRFPGDPLIARLEALVLRARATVYARSGRRASLWRFFTRGYWRRLAERPVLRARRLGAAARARRSPGGVWGAVDAPAAAGLVPARVPGGRRPARRGPRLRRRDRVGVLVRGHDQQHPGDAGRVRGRDRVRRR